MSIKIFRSLEKFEIFRSRTSENILEKNGFVEYVNVRLPKWSGRNANVFLYANFSYKVARLSGISY